LEHSQLSSIKQTQPPHLIFAGAGTDKTTTITAKIAHMVEMEGIDSLPGYSRSPSPKKLQGTCAKKSKNFFRDRK